MNQYYLLLICTVVILMTLNLLSKNKKTQNPHIRKILRDPNFISSNNSGSSGKKNSLQFDIEACKKKNTSEVNQVLLHRYIFDKLQEIKNRYYGEKALLCQYKIDNYNEYTITKKIKNRVLNLLKFVLEPLNKETEMNFIVTTIETVQIKTSLDGNNSIYLVDLFLHENKNFFEKKLLIEFHYCCRTNKEHINRIQYSLNNFYALNYIDQEILLQM